MEKPREFNKVQLQYAFKLLTKVAVASKPITAKEIDEESYTKGRTSERKLRNALTALVTMGYLEKDGQSSRRPFRYIIKKDLDKDSGIGRLLEQLKITMLKDLFNNLVEHELVQLLLLLQRTIPTLEGTGMMESYEKLLKLINTLGYNEQESEVMKELVVVKKGPHYDYCYVNAEPDDVIIETLLQACRDRKKVQIEYRHIHKPEVTTEIVDPYKLVLYGDSFYLVCFIESSAEPKVRPLNLKRFEKATIVEGSDCADIGQDCEILLERIDQSFGIHTLGDLVEKVTIVFKSDEYLAMYIPEKKWHKRSVVETTDEGIVLTMENILINIELVRWVLSWGNEVIRVEPEALRVELQKMAKSAY